MKTNSSTDGAMISSYLAATNMAVTPTSWNLMSDTTRFDRKRSMTLMAIHSVSGSMWYRRCTWSSQSMSVVRIDLRGTRTRRQQGVRRLGL